MSVTCGVSERRPRRTGSKRGLHDSNIAHFRATKRRKDDFFDHFFVTGHYLGATLHRFHGQDDDSCPPGQTSEARRGNVRPHQRAHTARDDAGDQEPRPRQNGQTGPGNSDSRVDRESAYVGGEMIGGLVVIVIMATLIAGGLWAVSR